MDRWNYGWEDPWGYEQESLYGGGYQAYEPRKEFVEGLLAQLQASQARISQETTVPEAYPHEQAYESRKPSLEEILAQLQASQALLQASQARLQASQEMLIHSNEQLEASLAQEPPFTIFHEHESFFDQMEPNSREEVYYEHHEQEFPIQDRDGDVHEQESELGYESFNGSEVRDYTSEEWVQSKLPNEGEILEDDSEEEDGLSNEEDAEFEVLHHNPLFIEEDAELQVIYHNPLFIEVDIPMKEESPSILCDGEEIEEPRTFSPPTSMEIHHELPKVDCRILSTYVIHENVEIKLTTSPPLPSLCRSHPPLTDPCPSSTSNAPPPSPRRPRSRAAASRRASPMRSSASPTHSSTSPTSSSTSSSPSPSTKPYHGQQGPRLNAPQTGPLLSPFSILSISKFLGFDLVTIRDSALLRIGIAFMKGLRRFRGELRTDREDVHMNIKAALTDLIGEAAKIEAPLCD